VVLTCRSVRNGGLVGTVVSMCHADQWDSTAELLAATPAPAGREAVWDQALAFLDRGHRDGAHLVTSVFVIDAGGLVLLARHRRYGQWGPLGGHLESGDASLGAAAARELFEEAALAAQVHPAPIDVLLSSYRCRTVTEPVSHLDVLFAASVAVAAPAVVASDEMAELEWFNACNLPVSLTPHAAELVGLATAAATLRC
jgi:8-oxo-dGTP pyrophosphatase MutT (NUDIX family)